MAWLKTQIEGLLWFHADIDYFLAVSLRVSQGLKASEFQIFLSWFFELLHELILTFLHVIVVFIEVADVLLHLLVAVRYLLCEYPTVHFQSLYNALFSQIVFLQLSYLQLQFFLMIALVLLKLEPQFIHLLVKWELSIWHEVFHVFW